jgi:hypothetical protein
MRQIKNSLLVLIFLAVGLPASAQNQPLANTPLAQTIPTDLIGVGVSILSSEEPKYLVSLKMGAVKYMRVLVVNQNPI